MKYLLSFVAFFACVYAQVSVSPEHAKKYPQYYYAKTMGRHPRDTSTIWNKEIEIGDKGKIFGTLGQDGSGLFGKTGYNHQIFNDHRGKLDAQAYGSRVLGAYGDSTKFGGQLNWADQNAKAGLDLSKPIGGHTALKATGEGLWNLNKNTQVSAGGFYQQPFVGHGRPDYGIQAGFKKDI